MIEYDGKDCFLLFFPLMMELFIQIFAWPTPILSSFRALLKYHLIRGDILTTLNKNKNLPPTFQQFLIF